MSELVKMIARRLLPRAVRQTLLHPARTIRWWREQREGNVIFSPIPDWSFCCPRTAVTGAFNAQLEDPPQVAEFSEFLDILKPLRSPLFFDIGCHFGIFSFAIARFCGPGARAVAIDPSDVASDMVGRIASLNGWSEQIDIRRAAMGNKPGFLEMVPTGVASSGYFVLPTDQPDKDRRRVPQHTMDQLVAEYGRPPDLVKIDVESYEFEVLQGGRATLSRGSIPVCLELHGQMLRDRGLAPAQVLALLREFGYTRFTTASQSIADATLIREPLVRFVAWKD